MAFSKINAAELLMKQVYGDWEELMEQKLFPKPLPAQEAGPSCVQWGSAGECQRRYLWTDAFGVLNFITLSKRHQEKKSLYLAAAKELISAVHGSLGQPRASHLPMAAGVNTPFGFKGLRIGKVAAKKNSDPGMTYDGMYWHYIDKWMYALLRYHQASNEIEALREAVEFIKAIHPAFLHKSNISGEPMGLHWKMNSDLTPIPGLGNPYPNDDALSGYLMYSLVQHASIGHKDIPSLDQECEELGKVARMYVSSGVHISSDPLGFGLWGWKSQWLGDWARPIRARLLSLAPHALNIASGIQLPFRLYGALVGAQLVSDPSTPPTPTTSSSPPPPLSSNLMQLVDQVLSSPYVIDREMRTVLGDEMGHTGINKVMLASALDPLAFTRLPDEPVMSMTTTAATATTATTHAATATEMAQEQVGEKAAVENTDEKISGQASEQAHGTSATTVEQACVPSENVAKETEQEYKVPAEMVQEKTEKACEDVQAKKTMELSEKTEHEKTVVKASEQVME